jgi:PAS domain S-box-containing protein
VHLADFSTIAMNVLLTSLEERLSRSRGFVLLLSIIGMLTIGGADYVTGPQIGLTIFYLIPVMLATWFAGLWVGVAMSLLCGLTWFASNVPWYIENGIEGFVYWNAASRTGMFLTIGLLLSKFKSLKDNLEEKVASRTALLQQDLARRTELERALSASEKVYKDLVENATVGVFRSNIWGEIQYVNPAMVQMFEFDSQEEMMARNALAFYKNMADRERFIDELKKHGRVVNFELQLLTKHQRERTVLLSASLDNDTISGMVRDITAQKAFEQRLTEIQRLESLGTLAGGIAHDFNNILGIILGHAMMVERFRTVPDRVKRGVEAIISASQRGSGLVRQLLTFARKTDVLLETAHINTVVSDVARLLSETFPKTITITTKLANRLPLITADVNQLHQVLINLCVNARDAMPSGGTLTLQTRLAGDDELQGKLPDSSPQQYVVVEVCDTGTGMSEEIRRRVFEPFFTTKERGKGTGLGLAVVYGIVQSHAGFVDVVSVPGDGSTFRVYLPAKGPSAEPETVKEISPEALPFGTETILIVEDEEQLRVLAQSVLEAHGYTVLAASDGEQAIEIYQQREKDIHLVLSDLGLPKLNGYDVFQRLLEINPSVRFVLTSGYIDPEQKAEVLAMGAKHVLQKPYTPQDLLLKVRDALDQ